MNWRKTTRNGRSLLDPFSWPSHDSATRQPESASVHGVSTTHQSQPLLARFSQTIHSATGATNLLSRSKVMSNDNYDIGERLGLLRDVELVLIRLANSSMPEMDSLYPRSNGKQPWGYVWASHFRARSCGRRFPLSARFYCVHPSRSKNDPGQSYRIVTDNDAGTFNVEVHEGSPVAPPVDCRVMVGL